jgi:hypothetical protein
MVGVIRFTYEHLNLSFTKEEQNVILCVRDIANNDVSANYVRVSSYAKFTDHVIVNVTSLKLHNNLKLCQSDFNDSVDTIFKSDVILNNLLRDSSDGSKDVYVSNDVNVSNYGNSSIDVNCSNNVKVSKGVNDSNDAYVSNDDITVRK